MFFACQHVPQKHWCYFAKFSLHVDQMLKIDFKTGFLNNWPSFFRATRIIITVNEQNRIFGWNFCIFLLNDTMVTGFPNKISRFFNKASIIMCSLKITLQFFTREYSYIQSITKQIHFWRFLKQNSKIKCDIPVTNTG